MQSLKDYLNESPLQHESILDPDQNKVLDRMTDDMIRSRIREYCTYDRTKLIQGDRWIVARSDLRITKIDKDKNGWYVETECDLVVRVTYNTMAKSYYDYCITKGQQIDKQKGFLISNDNGPDIYFRWRKHSGSLEIADAPNFESTEGLPDEMDELWLYNVCEKNKRLDVCNKIKAIVLSYMGDIKISGNGYKNVIIHPFRNSGNITVPSGVKIHRPKNAEEHLKLRAKISGC